jgi:hypothetical protein
MCLLFSWVPGFPKRCIFFFAEDAPQAPITRTLNPRDWLAATISSKMSP